MRATLNHPKSACTGIGRRSKTSSRRLAVTWQLELLGIAGAKLLATGLTRGIEQNAKSVGIKKGHIQGNAAPFGFVLKEFQCRSQDQSEPLSNLEAVSRGRSVG